MRVGASVHRDVYAPEYGWNMDERDPLYKFTAHLDIEGTSTYPDKRAGDAYEITIYGDDSPSQRLNLTLKDVQARDNHGAPQYRTYRGREIPVFNPPRGMGHIDKVRGEKRWTGWLWVAPRFVQDALVLLAHDKELYLAIHEYKEERSRHLRSITLQNTDPGEE